jgi:hypothetical protein
MHAAVLFPYRKLGQSLADVCVDTTGGKFGPFAGQVFCGDQMQCSVERAFLEKVEGDYQGACFPFVEGLDSGVNRVAFAPDGSMFVGQTDRGWGSTGHKSQGLQRIVYTGELPFEILAMRAKPDGFELEFTMDVEPRAAAAAASYRLSRFTYEYHADYGAPEADTAAVVPQKVELVGKRKVKLALREQDLARTTSTSSRPRACAPRSSPSARCCTSRPGTRWRTCPAAPRRRRRGSSRACSS